MDIQPAHNNLKYYTQLKEEIIQDNRGKVDFFDKIDALDKVKWSLPKQMEELGWMHKVTSSDGRDAIRTATRALSGVFPRIKWRPVGDSEDDIDVANQYERILELLLKQASDRNEVPIQRDVVKSACKYDMVASQVTYIPYQKKVSEAYGIGGDVKRWERALQNGPFMVKFRDPRTVHKMRSDYGSKAVLYVTKQKLYKIMEHWGQDKFKALFKDDKAKDLFTPYTVYDITTDEDRFVWLEDTKEPFEIFSCARKEPFFGDWVVDSGGSNLDDDSEYMFEPLLASVVHSGQWETQNIVETLGVSLEIFKAAKPGAEINGPGADKVEIDYTQPDQPVKTPAGTSYKPLPSEPTDQAKFALADRIADRMNRSSVARILQDAQMPSNTAFSAINSVIGIASTMLTPHRMLAERNLANILKRMVEWVHYDGEPLVVVGDGKEIKLDEFDGGMEYILNPAYYDPKDVHITVELETDLPLDKQQKINAASAAVTTLGYSKEQALEDIGVPDPKRMMEKSMIENITQAVLDAKIMEIQGEAQAKVQAMIAQAQMAIQQAQMQTQQPTQQAPMSNTDFNAQGTNTGDMYTPGQGGLPPAMANPEQTFEDQSGFSRAGEAINNVG